MTESQIKFAQEAMKSTGKTVQGQMFEYGDISQNKFTKKMINRFGLSTTQARSLAKEIKTYYQD